MQHSDTLPQTVNHLGQPISTLQKVIDILFEYDVIFFGGAVRDHFLDKPPMDIDVLVTEETRKVITTRLRAAFGATICQDSYGKCRAVYIEDEDPKNPQIKVDMVDEHVNLDFDINVLRLRKYTLDRVEQPNSLVITFHGHRSVVYTDECFPITTILQRIRAKQMVYLQCKTAKAYYPSFETVCHPHGGSLGTPTYNALRRRMYRFQNYGFKLVNRGRCDETIELRVDARSHVFIWSEELQTMITGEKSATTSIRGNCNMWDWDSLIPPPPLESVAD